MGIRLLSRQKTKDQQLQSLGIVVYDNRRICLFKRGMMAAAASTTNKH
jgi:hypothetical protein